MALQQGRLDKDTILGFSRSMLSKGFDNYQPTPQFHLELWNLCCSEDTHVAVAAPRGHAKSTAVTFIYVLACLLFRENDYVMIVSDTETQSKEFLNNISQELKDNQDVVDFFEVNRFVRDSATDMIVEMKDGHQFRVVAKGSEQKLRGLNWRGKRPNLIIGDDLENDEIVMSDERREKFRNWFFSALLPSGADYCKVRIVGTILHLDGLLERLMDDDSWTTKRYKAHDKEFYSILWPEKFPKQRLEEIRRRFVNQGYPEGYSQEYLNWPIDTETAMFRTDDLLRADEEQVLLPGDNFLAVDFAISEKEKSAYTAMVVVKRNHDGKLIVMDCMRGRWDSKEIIDNMFNLVQRYSVDTVIMEAEKVDKALGPYIYDEMVNRSVYFMIEKKVPSADKVQRARPLQALCRSGMVFFRKEKDWYPALESELTTFPRGSYKDQVDALAWVGLHINKIFEGQTLEEAAEEEFQEELEDSDFFMGIPGSITGY